MTAKSHLRGPVCCVLLLAFGCTDPATEIVVGVDTDYDVPAELGFVRAYTLRPDGTASERLEYDLTVTPLPFRFGIAPLDGDADLSFTVIVEGRRAAGDGSPRVVARAKTSFIEKKTLFLPMFLAKSCDARACSEGETCYGGDCVPEERDPNDLNGYDPNQPNGVPRPDAGMNPDTDGSVEPDAGDDGGVEPPDGGVDEDGGGTPDADQDAGLPQNCTLSLGGPALIGSAPIAFDPDLDLLAADVDGDGVTELVAARAQPVGSPMAVIDFGDCDQPVVTATASSGELRQGLLYAGGLLAVERRRISEWTYAGPNQISVDAAALARASEIERLAFASTGMAGLAVANLSGWSYVAFTAAGFGSSTPAADRPRGFSAYGFGATFLHGDDLGLRAVTPGVGVGDLSTGAADVRDPVAVSFDGKIVMAGRAGSELALAVRTDGVVSGTTNIPFGDEIIAGPVLALNGEDVRLYVLLADGTLTGCETHEDDGTCPVFNRTRGFGATEVDDRSALLTAWVTSTSGWPTVVFASRTGSLYFLDGGDLSVDSAPMIDLIDAPRAYPALVNGFFSAFGRTGSLLAVPQNGKVSLIGWTVQGPADRLWSQHRRDARRSARMD